jgi:ribosomal protein L25 (general stress protein Ctc)
MSQTKERQARALRAQGGPFAICYTPRAQVKPCSAPKKTGPKPKRDQSHQAKMLRDLADRKNPTFCISIATQSDSDKTARIRGRSL